VAVQVVILEVLETAVLVVAVAVKLKRVELGFLVKVMLAGMVTLIAAKAAVVAVQGKPVEQRIQIMRVTAAAVEPLQ
jgi:hypothetical protein